MITKGWGVKNLGKSDYIVSKRSLTMWFVNFYQSNFYFLYLIFRPRKKQITKHLIFRISCQRINTCSNVNYLCIMLEENLEWNFHLNLLKSKLNRAIGLLCKIMTLCTKISTKNAMLHHFSFPSNICMPNMGPKF